MPDYKALILASTSPYRREMLERLRIPFACVAPDLDESQIAGDSPSTLAENRACAKALAVSQALPRHWVLGSDQVCSFAGEAVRKPGTIEKQQQQLARFSAQEITFDTCVTLAHAGSCVQSVNVPTVVRFRTLNPEDIQHYVRREPAADCAGGFKVEGLGIQLFEWIRSDDPTALVGLPLIATSRLLRQHTPTLADR